MRNKPLSSKKGATDHRSVCGKNYKSGYFWPCFIKSVQLRSFLSNNKIVKFELKKKHLKYLSGCQITDSHHCSISFNNSVEECFLENYATSFLISMFFCLTCTLMSVSEDLSSLRWSVLTNETSFLAVVCRHTGHLMSGEGFLVCSTDMQSQQ